MLPPKKTPFHCDIQQKSVAIPSANGHTSPSSNENGYTFHIQKCLCITHLPLRSVGEYSDLSAHKSLNYGNDGCDGFAPNFPLIRMSGTNLRYIRFRKTDEYILLYYFSGPLSSVAGSVFQQAFLILTFTDRLEGNFDIFRVGHPLRGGGRA